MESKSLFCKFKPNKSNKILLNSSLDSIPKTSCCFYVSLKASIDNDRILHGIKLMCYFNRICKQHILLFFLLKYHFYKNLMRFLVLQEFSQKGHYV